jgi:hypothetical protein
MQPPLRCDIFIPMFFDVAMYVAPPQSEYLQPGSVDENRAQRWFTRLSFPVHFGRFNLLRCGMYIACAANQEVSCRRIIRRIINGLEICGLGTSKLLLSRLLDARLQFSTRSYIQSKPAQI